MISDETSIGAAGVDAGVDADADIRTGVFADGVRLAGGVPEAVAGITRDRALDGKKPIRMTSQRSSDKFSMI